MRIDEKTFKDLDKLGQEDLIKIIKNKKELEPLGYQVPNFEYKITNETKDNLILGQIKDNNEWKTTLWDKETGQNLIYQKYNFKLIKEKKWYLRKPLHKGKGILLKRINTTKNYYILANKIYKEELYDYKGNKLGLVENYEPLTKEEIMMINY